MTDETHLATLRASMLRRLFAYSMLFLLGVMSVMLALHEPPAFGWQVALVATGAACLLVAERLRRATLMGLVLTDEGLRDTQGTFLARIEDIASVERGSFAFKPSNGFVVLLKSSGPWGWAPGLYWRYGKRVGVGGVTPSGPAKVMADQIAMRVAAQG